MGVTLGRIAQHRERVVGARVVDAEHLITELAGVHRRRDALDLLEHVGALVVAGQNDRHVGRRSAPAGPSSMGYAACPAWWEIAP